ncbi:MAG: hypothetical protein Q9222_006432 [Ikaeria aurantiellina]
MAMRKLREAIVASSRSDVFAKTVYIFIIRTAILLRHPESYHPALLHLLRRIHITTLLSKVEENEFLTCYVLDLACRQNDLPAAFRVRCQQALDNRNVDVILSALVHGNWVRYWETRNAAAAQERLLISYADERMMRHAVQCLGKSYLSIKKEFVERFTGTEWQKLKDVMKLSWDADGEVIVIRRIMKR